MSILKKAYTISVWDDIWDEKTSKFVEKRLGIIGSDKMESHCRAMSPNFTRNVNGTKKLTFKMYYRYKDNITGEIIKNPFVDWLVSERKVKLYYEDKWYDFIVKNIVENSKDYVYTYQLEDALVQELSKNGFNVTLDSKLMNNLGTANELAAEVLKETDWEVSPESEVFVQTIEEALIYGRLPNDWPRALDIYRIFDQDKNNRQVGVDPKLVGTNGIVGPKAGDEILIFYSSTQGKPYRFQFIWVDSSTPIKKDKENRVIVNENCQFYFDVPKESDYLLTDGYYLPHGIKPTSHKEDGVNVTLSSLYRGKRYGFTQRTKFIPILDKYVNIYKKGEVEYYGYLHSEYNSPALIQNVISNTQFESTSGWTGARQEGGKKAKVENVYGRFDDSGNFISALSDLQDGAFKTTKGSYTAYLKITFDGSKSIVVNSGPYDNRISIGEMNVGDEWALWYKVLNSSGKLITNLNQGPQFKLSEEKYDSSVDAYKSISSPLTFTPFADNDITVQITKDGKTTNKTYQLSTVGGTAKSKEDFKKKSQVRLIISPPSGATDSVYYIELIELFKATYNNGKLITLEEQGETVEDRVIDKSYYYFPSSAIATLEDKEQLIPEAVSKTLLNETYIPYFNVGAEKIRSINQKESNYFNILQTIAETFEAWLLLEVERAKANDPDGYSEGSVKKKWIKFKNYIGKDNYAGFKYGVNLDSIQRTNESKSIVTKLMVKPNNNQHAKNGFCTIARANANPTGETFIYDFQYFINRGLLNARQYLDNVYVPQTDDALGADMAVYLGKEIQYSKDGTNWTSIADDETKYYQIKNNDSWGATCDYDTVKISGYFGRLKALNRKITDQNELLVNTAKDLTQYKAKYEIAKSGLEAAEAGIEKVYADYEFLTNKKMVDLNGKPVAVEEAEAARSDVKKLLEEYLVYSENKTKYALDEEKIGKDLATAQSKYDNISKIVSQYTEQKRKLNQAFFSQYSRFIQEGTWLSEEYVDDEKYYADALSVMYNSCYPQVTYTINVLELSQNEGYELFQVELGDKTYAEDKEFFGSDIKEEVVVTELSEDLDDPSKNRVKVQNFKNQFQDLFQKITATVQQAKYSTGSYEKAVALAEANQERKQQFLTDALDSASARLAAAGQQSVTWGNDGITVKSVDSPCDAIRMVGGAILLSKQNKNGEQQWVTGVTSDGVSASLITAGILNAGEIAIMNYDEPVFRWDTYGISAYEAAWEESDIGDIVSGVTPTKFVRFDKNGIYGINNDNINGQTWHPTGEYLNGDLYEGKTKNDRILAEINDKSTFALTWEGLKVTGNNGGTALLGKQERNGKSYIMTVSTPEDGDTFRISEDGRIEVAKSLKIGITDEDVSIEDYVGNAVDSIQVGGKNLLRRDNYVNRKTISQNSTSGYGFTHDATTEIVEFGGIKIPFLNTNTEYIVSFTTWIDTDDENVKQPFNCDIQETPEEIFTATKYPTRMTWIINSSNIESSYEDYYYLRFFSNQLMDDHYVRYPIYITDIQLERGNKASDWAPAPEDVSADISLVNELCDNLQSQIDGEITSWFYEGEPTLKNAPANEWIALDDANNNLNERNRHLGDLYYDTLTQYAYRWSSTTKDGITTYAWERITDEGISKALKAASDAQAAADGKMKVFSTEPKPPYQVGDLWAQGSTGDLKRCVNARTSGSYVASDWALASKYTDDTVANSKMDPSVSGDFSWYFDKDYGMMMWSGASPTSFENYDMAQDTNLLFRIYKDKNEGKLWMRGSGEFSGTLSASTIIGSAFKNNDETLYLSTTPKEFTFNDEQKSCVLRIGDNFGVDSDGILYAKGVNIEGSINVTEGGKVGGWSISDDALYTAGNALYLGTDGTRATINNTTANFVFKAGSNFGVTSTGALYAGDAHISGSINVTNGGKVGGWDISNNALCTTGNALYLGTTGITGSINNISRSELIFKAGSNFGVTSDGKLYASNADISGTITANNGNIGDFTIQKWGLGAMENNISYCGITGPSNAAAWYGGEQIVFYAGEPAVESVTTLQFPFKFKVPVEGEYYIQSILTSTNYCPVAPGVTGTVYEVTKSVAIDGPNGIIAEGFIKETETQAENATLMEAPMNLFACCKKAKITVSENHTATVEINFVPMTEWDMWPIAWGKHMGVNTTQPRTGYSEYMTKVRQMLNNAATGGLSQSYIKFQMPTLLSKFFVTKSGDVYINGKLLE